MKNAFWFLIGIIGGFALAHMANNDPRGHEVLADIDARITEFTDRIGDAYRSQEAKFDDAIDSVTGAANEAIGKATEAAKKIAD